MASSHPHGRPAKGLPRAVFDAVARRVRAELDQHAPERPLDLAMLGANDGYWDWDVRTDQIYFSPRWKEMLGYADHEIPNRVDEWFSRVHPDDKERARAAVKAHLDGKTPYYELEHRMRHKDGHYVWIQARGASLRDERERVVRMAGSHADVSARKQAEAVLAEREEQHRSIVESTSDGLVVNDLDTGLILEVNPAFCRMHGYTREELIGAHPTRFIHPDSLPLFDEYVRTVRAGGEYRCQAIDTRKDGAQIHVEVHGSAITFAGRRSLLGVVRDITERVQAHRLLAHEVAERTLELSTLLDVSNTMASTLELQPLLGLTFDQLKRVADYTGSSILTLAGDTLTVLDVKGASAAQPGVVGLRFPLVEGTPIADTIYRRQPVIVGDVRDDSDMAQAYRGAVGELMETPAFAYVRSWMSVPMLLKNEVTGILSVGHEQPGFYTWRHARLASAIANQAAVAIENARLFEQAQALAVLEERQRLARELHDSVTQSLFSMTMISAALPRVFDRNPQQARERLERLNELAQGALAEMRALIFELHPETLEREGLVVALDKQADAVRARHGIPVETDLCAEPDAPREVKEALYRIGQEALHNTVKHARASQVRLSLAVNEGGIVLTVQDDGVGFDTSQPFPGHMGQRTMRERATRLGGSITVESAPGAGTRVHAWLPLAAARASAPAGTESA